VFASTEKRGFDMGPSWDKDCEKLLSARWNLTRNAWLVAPDGHARNKIETDWYARLHRLYANTSMPERTLKKFFSLADRLFIEKVT